MTPEQRKRAGQAVAERLDQLGMTVPQLAAAAQVHPSTIRALLHGARWPADRTRDRLTAALQWPRGEIARRAVQDSEPLSRFTALDLLEELYRRARAAGI